MRCLTNFLSCRHRIIFRQQWHPEGMCLYPKNADRKAPIGLRETHCNVRQFHVECAGRTRKHYIVIIDSYHQYVKSSPSLRPHALMTTCCPTPSQPVQQPNSQRISTVAHTGSYFKHYCALAPRKWRGNKRKGTEWNRNKSHISHR